MDKQGLMIGAMLSVLWAGTESAFSEMLDFKLKAESPLQASLWGAPQPAAQAGQEQEVPYLLTKVGNIGLISIAGSMSNETEPYDKYYGTASYPAIREAVAYAAADDSIQKIILDISSGGGSVAGVADTGHAIRNVNDNIKPVVAYTDAAMMSAAYWLASSAGNIFSSSTAMVGSIGVIQMHVERSKMLKEMGITATVMRAGKYKALANGVEPLSDEAKAEMQGQLDEAYKVFVSHVAESRGLPYDTVDATMAQGREFFGKQAQAAGLVDGILSFDELIALMQSA